MRVVKIIGIVILLISVKINMGAQSIDYMSEMEHIFDHQHEHTSYANYILDADNPLEFLFATLFVGYKYLLSSQDLGSTCVFHPSCSVYAIQSIKEKGIFFGMMNTFDRLSRCHPFAGGNYYFDPEKQRLYDPVD